MILDEKIYFGNFKKMTMSGILFVVLGVLASWGLYGEVQKLLTEAKGASLQLAFAFFIFSLLAPTGMMVLISVARKLPRLVLTPWGIEWHTIWSVKTAEWKSLSEFTVHTLETRRTTIRTLRAAIVGEGISDNLRGRRTLEISGFDGELAEIASALNAQRNMAWQNMSPDTIRRKIEHFNDAQTKERPVWVGNRMPLLTYGLLAVLVVMYGVEVMLPVTPSGALFSPSVPTMLALGALSKLFIVGHHEWYRLFTAPLLHGGIIHLLFNGYALLMAGVALEAMVGRAWFFTLFFVGALGGSLMSLAVGGGITSVGASGAIMGLFAALWALSFRFPNKEDRSGLQTMSMQVLIPSLLPLFAGTGVHVDYGAHLGGAISGGLAAYILAKSWNVADAQPPFQGLVQGLAVFGAILFIGSLYMMGSNYNDTVQLLNAVLAAQRTAP